MADPNNFPGATAGEPPVRVRHVMRRFWAVAGGYWKSERRVRAWTMTGALVLLGLATICVQIWINFWNRDFFNTLEQRDWTGFYVELWTFVIIVVVSVASSAAHLHIKRKLQLDWRSWLSEQTVARWLEAGRHYQLQFMPGSHDNADGRIAEDVRIATEWAVEFAHSILHCILLLVSFISILWALSGVINVTVNGVGIEIPGYMVWVAIAYAAFGSVLTFFLGRPLVAATDERQSREADFRFGLVRVRENAEGIALLRGEADERRRLLAAFTGIHGAWDKQTHGQRRLIMLTTAYATLAGVFPIIVAAPRYFAGAITLGGLMQTAQAFVQVQSALSWFVDNFARFAEWFASVERVLDLHDALDELDEDLSQIDEYSIVLQPSGEGGLVFDALHIAHPDGTVLVNDATAEIKPGERVLITGESGSGKSMLFRAIAGLWPWGRGRIGVPMAHNFMFMPQRPYLPVGTLRNALLYPKAPDSLRDEELLKALTDVGLEKLGERLDEDAQWDHVLSGGEQQRLAYARVLVHKPDWVFLDEATSALDDENQEKVMHALTDSHPNISVLSVAHRPGLEAFHQRQLVLIRTEDGATLVRSTRARRAATRDAAIQRRTRREALLKKLSTSFNPAKPRDYYS